MPWKKKMKRAIALAALAWVITGCSTPVVPMGPDSYMVSKSGWNSLISEGSLKADVYLKADTYCKSINKHMVPVRDSTKPGTIYQSYPEAELEFMCLSDGDPQLTRTRMLPDPH